MTRVFIGSTSRDLADYRQAAIDTCEKLGLQLVVMEHFPAMGVGATEGSKRKVDEADLYIGIFAHRYGYIEDGYDKSVTEIEFDYAEERNLERLCFLIDPNHPLPISTVDVENFAKLQAFKARIDKTLIRAQFTTIDDFTAKLMHALVEYQRSHNKQDRFSYPAGTTVLATFAKKPEQIPNRATNLIGREELQNEVENLLVQAGRVLLQGFGGMGKTALAAEIAAKWINEKDSVIWIEAGNSESNTLFKELGRLLGKEKEITSAINKAKQVILQNALAESSISLLVIDNVWEEDAIIPIMNSIPQNLPVLVTSRHRLWGRGLRVVGKLEPSMSLKVLEFYAECNYFNSPEAVNLCEALGHHALALKIAGNALAEDEITPGQLLEDYKNVLHNLEMQFENSEHRSVVAVLETSLNALKTQGHRGNTAYDVFLIFGTLFTMSATAQLIYLYMRAASRKPNSNYLKLREVDAALGLLVKRGLIERVRSTEDFIAYYKIHELAYSYTHAYSTDENRGWVLKACQAYMEEYNQPSLKNFIALHPEIDNFLEAAKWAFSINNYSYIERCVENLYLAGSEILDYLGLYTEAILLLDMVLKAAIKQRNLVTQAIYLGNLGFVYQKLGQHQQAIKCHHEALSLSLKIGEPTIESDQLGNLGNIYRLLHEYQEATRLYQKQLAISQKFGQVSGICNALTGLGHIYADLGQYKQAIEAYRQALTISQKFNDYRNQSNQFGNLGLIYTYLGQYQQAAEYHQEALKISRKIGDRLSIAQDLGNLGSIYSLLEQYEQALNYYQEACNIFQELGLPHKVLDLNLAITSIQAVRDESKNENSTN